MFLSKLPQVLVHDLASPCTLSPKVHNHVFTLFGNIEKIFLLDHGVLPMSNSKLLFPISSNGLHLLEALSAELLEVVNLQSIHFTNLLIEHIFAVFGGFHQSTNQALLHCSHVCHGCEQCSKAPAK